MRKRRLNAPDGDGPPRKRAWVVHEAPTFEEIHSARQLMQLLSFEQDIQKTRHGLQSFKILLDRINDTEKRTPEDVAILHGFLQSTSPRKEKDEDGNDNDNDDEAVYLADIMDSWHFGVKLDNDNVKSSVPVVLALLLKYLSGVLELTPIGLGICRTLLLPRQLDLLARNLSVEKSKEFVLSPTLRMLREVVLFDGGAVAKSLFRARNFTLRSLARNMSIKLLGGDGLEDAKRTSTRTNAVRFLLALLKFLHPEAKAELLSQRDIVGALTRFVKDDPAYLVHELLDGLRNDVVRDKKLTRLPKSRLFNAATLINLASLYGYTHDSTDNNNKMAVSDAAHQFLLHVCTTSGAGVLRDQYGCYPRGVESDTTPATTVSTAPAELEEDGLDGQEDGLGRIVWIDKFVSEVPVHNMVLAELLGSLRPWSSTRQNELVVSVFRAAPELIAWYFIHKKAFTFEPKISATWVGFSALLFRTIQVDLPAFFGSRLNQYAGVPPPTSVLVDNILPLPLSQKTLGRCLNHKSKLAPFFAMRLLGLALEKLRRALQMHDEAAQSCPAAAAASLWRESARRVVDEFGRRCSPMKDIITTYRGIADSDDNLLYREAASRVLRLCYEVTPQVALLAKFDVSSSLFTVLRQASDYHGSPQDKALKLMELANLLAIAGYSPGMRWFSKAEGLATSPFVALVRVYTEAPAGLALDKIRTMLDFVAREHEIVLSAGLSALCNSLQQPIDGVWAFVDNCAVRCALAPIKYMEMLQDLAGGAASTVDPLTMAMAEQLPFATASSADDEAVLDALADFVQRYFQACSGDKSALKPVFAKVAAAFPAESRAAVKLAKLPKRRSKKAEMDKADEQTDVEPKASPVPTDVVSSASLETLLDLPPLPALDNSALTRWTNRSADELVEEGYAGALVQLLVSEHTSIRREALVNVTKMAAKIRESTTYAEKEQTWLLLSELAATTRAWMADATTADQPLPSPLVAFARHALDVLGNPLHCLYDKVNTFLTAGPVWRVRSVPLVHAVLRDGPTKDDSFYAELSWLLAYLLDSLRTPADVDLFRTRRLFETLLSAAANPYMRFPLRRQILRILCRAVAVDGGSTTLVTRAGVVSWLGARPTGGLDETETHIVEALMKRLWETCDQERVDSWSMHGGGVGEQLFV